MLCQWKAARSSGRFYITLLSKRKGTHRHCETDQNEQQQSSRRCMLQATRPFPALSGLIPVDIT